MFSSDLHVCSQFQVISINGKEGNIQFLNTTEKRTSVFFTYWVCPRPQPSVPRFISTRYCFHCLAVYKIHMLSKWETLRHGGPEKSTCVGVWPLTMLTV